jgi:diguanylate cyclase (GGDEF)-like protein
VGLKLTSSLHGRISALIGLFALMLVGLSTVAATGLLAIDKRAESINDKWLSGTRILGELSDRISEFRIAEAYRALAADQPSIAAAESLAMEHQGIIEDLQGEYLALLHGDSPPADMAPVRSALDAYFAGHRAWLVDDSDGAFDDPARLNSSLHHLYKAADQAVDVLIDANAAAAQAEVDAADRIVDGTAFAVSLLAGLIILLAIWLMGRARRNISRPLEAITTALSGLAAGDLEVRVPEINRDDEIGRLAKAFDGFRANVLALEQAHEMTRLAQEQAQALARHDPLTGLPNRRVFFAELETAVDRSRRGSAAYSVLLIDLDGFKAVNDLQGHPVGDLLLYEIARRLTEVTRKTDTVARLGGDEFAIITAAEPQDHLQSDIGFANRVLEAIREPLAIGDNLFEMDASIGIVTCPAEGLDAEGLVRAADIAMYRAKKEGRGSFRFFEQEMDDELRAQSVFEADLRKAVADELVQPYYQPLVDMNEDRICGFEILARWHDPTHGWVPPDRFIPVAERLGLIPKLMGFLLRRACRDAAGWGEHIHLSLNVAPSQFKDPLLPAQLLSILQQEGFSPSRLEVEMTETALIRDVATARSIIAELHKSGISVSLDDFGTGYSSLYHLKEFKFDKIKIDRSFISSLQYSPESEKFVDAILSLARSLGLPTVAEGIEDQPVLRHLTSRGCEYGQGYYFGKAMAAADAAEILRREPIMAA